MTLSWTREHDHVWGPFLYAPEPKRSGWALMADSGDGDDYPGATLRLSVPGHTFKVALPQWMFSPYRRKKFYRSAIHDATQPQGDGPAANPTGFEEKWYWDSHSRQFGFSFSDTGMVGGCVALHLHYGPQTHDSETTKSAVWFLPWTSWRFVSHRYYTPEGALIREFLERPRSRKNPTLGHDAWREQYDWKNSQPTTDFAFDDFDGERITVKTRIEEREWRSGEGWFRWLSAFRKPIIHRSLDLAFSAETGERKGSWKGGTLGHSTEIAVGETPESAFRRYCEKNGMTFIGEVAQ